jgi:Cys-rich protein (TIGR01571 family)
MVGGQDQQPDCVTTVEGDLDVHQAFQVDDNALVHGSVRVGGDVAISGHFSCPGADFAEWFAWDMDDDSRAPKAVSTAAVQPRAGSVVQLRMRTRRLSLRTDGDGPAVIVSSSPSLVGNMLPDEREAAACGGLVVLVGQAPVRCRGAVAAGDTLVPSGCNDGCAISAGNGEAIVADEVVAASSGSPWHTMPRIGTALERSSEGEDGKEGDEHLVNCLVRWDDVAQRRAVAAIAADLALMLPDRVPVMAADRSAQSSSIHPSWLVAFCACSSKRAWQLGLFGLVCPCVVFARTHSIATRIERDRGDVDVEGGCGDGAGGSDSCCYDRSSRSDEMIDRRSDRSDHQAKRANRRYLETFVTFSALLLFMFMWKTPEELPAQIGRAIKISRVITTPFALISMLIEAISGIDWRVAVTCDMIPFAGGIVSVCRLFHLLCSAAAQSVLFTYCVWRRQALRRQLGIVSGGIATVGRDCFAWFCCPVCALVQEAREVELIANDPCKTAPLPEGDEDV